jgi:hypothetical protein
LSRQISPAPEDNSFWSLQRLVQAGFDLPGSFVDPASKLTGAVTLAADGLLTVPLAGTWLAAGSGAGNTWDPGTDGVYTLIPLYTRRGVRFTGDVGGDFRLRLRSPSLVAADDVCIAAGIANESTLLGSTVDAALAVLDFSTGVGPRTRASILTNGAASSLNAGGTLSASGVGLETRFSKNGKGGGAAGSLICGLLNTLIDSTSNLISGTAGNPTSGVGSPGTGDNYLLLAFGRTNAANVTAKSVQLYVDIGPIAMVAY